MNLLPSATDVVIIGGGPAGLAAAVAARQRGFAVTLADCSTPPIDKACGEGIMPDGMAAAAALGFDLRDAGGYPFRGIRFREGDISVGAAFPQGSGLGLQRTALHSYMVERAAAAGVRMAWGARITGLGDGAVIADGRTVRARWIVGADGGRSLVRRWAGLEACQRDSRRYGFRRHYRVAPWSEHMELHWADAGQLYLTPVSADEVCAVLISRDPRLRLDEAFRSSPKPRAV